MLPLRVLLVAVGVGGYWWLRDNFGAVIFGVPAVIAYAFAVTLCALAEFIVWFRHRKETIAKNS